MPYFVPDAEASDREFSKGVDGPQMLQPPVLKSPDVDEAALVSRDQDLDQIKPVKTS